MKVFALFSLLIIKILAVNAQKLPNKQEASVWAPSNLKIDGKADEWNDHFHAYNHATELFYTVANNSDNLYLIIKATDADIINKVYKSGVTFIISTLDKKNAKKVSVHYPVFEKNDRFSVNLRSRHDESLDSITLHKMADSFRDVTNTQLTKKSKWITVNGINGLDTVSVYNDDGIKAAALFDKKMFYVMELSINLKLLDISLNSTEKISYQVKLNELKGSDNVTKTRLPDGRIMADPGFVIDANYALRMKGLYAATDFSAEYTLAKAP